VNFQRMNPLTSEVASEAKAMTVSDVNAIAERASSAFSGWAELGPNARRGFLSKAASALEAKADDFVDAMMSEIGATEGWARFNLMLSSLPISLVVWRWR